MKLTIGVFVTAVVLFVFGFLYWAVNPLVNESLNAAPDPARATAAVREQFPETGIYSVPAPDGAPSGVRAMVIVDHEVPDNAADPLAMVYGFVHYIVIAILLAAILRRGATLAEHTRRAPFWVWSPWSLSRAPTSSGGLSASAANRLASSASGPSPHRPRRLWGAAYHVLVFAIGAVVLFRFLPSGDSGRTG